MSESKGHLFFPLLRRLVADWYLFRRVMIAQGLSKQGVSGRKSPSGRVMAGDSTFPTRRTTDFPSTDLKPRAYGGALTERTANTGLKKRRKYEGEKTKAKARLDGQISRSIPNR